MILKSNIILRVRARGGTMTRPRLMKLQLKEKMKVFRI